MAKARTLAVGFAAIASAGVIGGVTALALVGQSQPAQQQEQERIVQQVADETTEVVEPTPEPSPSDTPAPTVSPTPTKAKATKTSGGGAKAATTEEPPADPEPAPTKPTQQPSPPSWENPGPPGRLDPTSPRG